VGMRKRGVNIFLPILYLEGLLPSMILLDLPLTLHLVKKKHIIPEIYNRDSICLELGREVILDIRSQTPGP